MKFRYNPRILKQLGTELITSDEIAITELIKNSYDAGAKTINVYFADNVDTIDRRHLKYPISPKLDKILRQNEDGNKDDTAKKTITTFSNIMIIEDDGKGMDLETIEKGFFIVGTTIKKDEKREKQDKILLGDKGIGRLSAQRISPILILESTSKNDNSINVMTIQWNDFIESTEAETIDAIIPKNNNISYTRLWLIGTEENTIQFNNYFEETIISGHDLFGNPILLKKPELLLKDDLQHALSFLFSPFEDRKAIININFRYNSKGINVNFHSDTLKIAETVHSFDFSMGDNTLKLKFNLKITPWFLQRIHRKLLGKKFYQDWEKDATFYGELLKKYKKHFEVSLSREYTLEDLSKDKIIKKALDKSTLKFVSFSEAIKVIAPIKGKVYSFKRDNSLLKMGVDSALAHGIITEDSTLNEIRSFLDSNNGIKLYRNQYRIGTIGNKDDDWIKLQQERTKGQQFYRFELGNIIGYADVNDPLQDYISETSSRQRINDNPYYKSLFLLIDFIFNHKFYDFNRYASEIAKNIFNEEELVPKNTEEEVKEQAEKTRATIEIARANIKAFQKAFGLIKENIDMDSEQKIERVRDVLLSIEEQTNNFQENFKNTLLSLDQTDQISRIIELRKEQIETEAYNNYKLMANGLVTEVITHELHSLVSRKQHKDEVHEQFESIKSFLFEKEAFDINQKHLHPLRANYNNLLTNIEQINIFYHFLEKTFLYKGNKDDYEPEYLNTFLTDFLNRFNKRLAKNKISVNLDNTDVTLDVPRGSLVHIFYNLIDNSIYWIQERQRRAKDDKFYQKNEDDKIVITKVNDYTIRYYDSGLGVLNQYQYTLFNPLISGKNNGRGMGLYIIRNFLESFGANISLLENRNNYNNRYIFEITFRNNQEAEE